MPLGYLLFIHFYYSINLKYNIMKTTLKKLGLTVKQVKEQKQICQSHFGDYLKFEIEISKDEKYKVWQSHTENVKLGQKAIQIEYFGKSNGYVWEYAN